MSGEAASEREGEQELQANPAGVAGDGVCRMSRTAFVFCLLLPGVMHKDGVLSPLPLQDKQ
jgi:hypothetical protein